MERNNEMTIEKTNTRTNNLIPEGTYTFTVIGRPEKFRSQDGQKTYRKWMLTFQFNGNKITASKIFFPWNSRELLLSLGGQESPDNPDEIIWDDEQVDGKAFSAHVVHERAKDGKMRENFLDIKKVNVAWDE